MWKTIFRDMNQNIEANELNPLLNNVESVESRAKNIILA